MTNCIHYILMTQGGRKDVRVMDFDDWMGLLLK